MTKNGGPAFPCDPHTYNAGGLCGMSLRDYFAAVALRGMLANPKWPNCGPSGLPASEEKCAAHWAYDFADAMLAERDGKVTEKS